MAFDTFAGKTLCGNFEKAPASSGGAFLQPASLLWFECILRNAPILLNILASQG
jgi:hypothetical protein